MYIAPTVRIATAKLGGEPVREQRVHPEPFVTVIEREHDEIPPRMVADNADVGSFSNCNACHQGAAEGVYDEDRVKIPGFGRWED